MHATGEYSISDLAELFSVSRPTVYRTLKRRHSPWRTILPPTGIDPDYAISTLWLQDRMHLRENSGKAVIHRAIKWKEFLASPLGISGVEGQNCVPQ